MQKGTARGGAPNGMAFHDWDMFKAWNSAFVGDVCKHRYLKGAPGQLYVYDPPDGQKRPIFRYLPNATTPKGLQRLAITRALWSLSVLQSMCNDAAVVAVSKAAFRFASST
jgi:hypothetical protein